MAVTSISPQIIARGLFFFFRLHVVVFVRSDEAFCHCTYMDLNSLPRYLPVSRPQLSMDVTKVRYVTNQPTYLPTGRDRQVTLLNKCTRQRLNVRSTSNYTCKWVYLGRYDIIPGYPSRCIFSCLVLFYVSRSYLLSFSFFSNIVYFKLSFYATLTTT